MVNKTKFCGDLLAIRRKNNRPKMSQQFVADEVGVSKMSINYWEKGLYQPKAKYIKKLAKLFNIPEERFKLNVE